MQELQAETDLTGPRLTTPLQLCKIIKTSVYLSRKQWQYNNMAHQIDEVPRETPSWKDTYPKVYASQNDQTCKELWDVASSGK